MGRGAVTKVGGKRGIVYKAVHDVAPDPATGKRRQRSKSFATRREADAYLARVRHEQATQTYVAPSRLPLAELLDRYLEAHARRVKPATLLPYRSYAKGIAALIGHLRLESLTPIAVQRAMDTLAEGRTARTVRCYHSFLSAACAQGVAWRLLARNPCQGLILPVAHAERTGTAWDAAACARFLAGTADHPRGLVFRVALLTSLRRNEVLALRWGDVDLAHRLIHVRHALSRYAHGKYALSTPKTRSSVRTISLDQETAAHLAVHHEEQRRRRRGGGEVPGEEEIFVFTDNGADPLFPDAVTREFGRAVRALGLPRITFHGLRHTHASLLFEQQHSPRVIMDRLGHSAARMTLERYTHASPDADRRAVEGLSASFVSSSCPDSAPVANAPAIARKTGG